MSKLHYHLFTKEEADTFERLKVFKKDATLAGGTALMLQIAHRRSYDFDMFFSRPLMRRDLARLKKHFQVESVGMNTEDLLHITTKEYIRIHCVYYPFKSLYKVVPTSSLPLFAVKDIAADKAQTVGRRAAWRDYVDLFFLFKKKYVSGEEAVRLARRKFDVEFNARLFIEQLGYFEDLETTKVSFIDEKFSAKEIQDFLISEAKRLVKRRVGIDKT